jgi:hypothetical protein
MKSFDKKEKNQEAKNIRKNQKSFSFKLKLIATKMNLFLKKHFPKRIWNKAQEKNKGHKF